MVDFLLSLDIQWREIFLALMVVMGLAIWGLVKNWWVPGPRYQEVLAEMHHWRDKFFDTVGIAEEAVDTADEGLKG